MRPAVPLWHLAHARSGDKGDRVNIAVVCRREEFFPLLASQLTVETVLEVFSDRTPSLVRRFDLPKLASFNFVLDNALDGGVNASLGLDGHGKTLSYMLLRSTISVESVPDQLYQIVVKMVQGAYEGGF